MTQNPHDWQRRIARLEFELARVRQTVENQFARLEVLEDRLSTPPQPPTATHSLSLPRGETPMVTTLKAEADSLVFHATRPPAPALQGSPGLSCYSDKDAISLILAIAVFNHDTAHIRGLVRMVAENQRRTRGFSPVFLTNNPDFSPYRSQKYIYEYFDTGTGLSHCLSDDRKRTYLQERFQFLLRKWSVGLVVDLSAPETADSGR